VIGAGWAGPGALLEVDGGGSAPPTKKEKTMSEIDRRALLAGTAALAASSLAPALPALAAAPAALRQVPGAYRYKLGDFELTAVTDGIARRPLDAGFVRNAKIEDVKHALDEAFLSTDTLGIPFTALVVNTGNRMVLIDAGNGGMASPTAGQLAENMTAAGIEPAAIDSVVVSHFHGDHINGIRAKSGELVFPNAEILVPEGEWAFWMDEGQASRAPEAMKGGFKAARRVFGPNAKQVRRFAADADVLPGVTAVPAPGHTPGHSAFRIASGNQAMLLLSDTTNHPALFVRNPTWQAVFDMDGDKAIETRRRLLDMAVADRLLVQGYHYPFPASGHIAKDGDRYRYVPIDWNPVL
jgi:glyoxylase-like metal-dependent hydrolase (beta-lactamase superfamily II)